MKSTMARSIEESWQAISSRICAKCIDGDGLGNCRFRTNLECGLDRYLPLIVEVIEGIPVSQAWMELIKECPPSFSQVWVPG